MPMLEVGTEAHHAIELHYEDYGSGKPVVLIHGWPCRTRPSSTKACWSSWRPEFRSRSHRPRATPYRPSFHSRPAHEHQDL